MKKGAEEAINDQKRLNSNMIIQEKQIMAKRRYDSNIRKQQDLNENFHKKKNDELDHAEHVNRKIRMLEEKESEMLGRLKQTYAMHENAVK